MKESPRASSGNAAPITTPRWLPLDFALTILVSAFLLFQVQPLISKLILPWFGGSPAVWTTCMLFFQVVLFGGYTYAHLSTRLLTPRGQGLLHLALLALAIALLPIAPGPTWKTAHAASPTLRILLLLGANVGLPYFALSATGPLVQAWFARAYPGRSPYRLYALSNAGSLLALLSYPFVFEPLLDGGVHAKLWSWGFALFAIPCGAAALWLRHTRPAPGTAEAAPGDEPPRLGRRVLWLVLPACATLMLLAATNHVCQEVAVIPFLWVVPLSLYLLSFIVTFDHERWYKRGFFAVATALLTLAVAGEHLLSALLDRVDYEVGFAQQVVTTFAALFSICMLCHGELVRLRPRPRHLTEFYLIVSAGGALGGMLVSLVSPLVFTTFVEWKLGLAASFAIAAVVVASELWRRLRPRTLHARLALALPVVAGIGCVGAMQTSSDKPIDVARNFYGVVSVEDEDEDEPADNFRTLIHGTTVHGRQFQAPDKRNLPIAYYGPQTGVGQTLRYLQGGGPIRVGAVGLGVGTLAAYARAGDSFTFFELNGDVERMARAHFTYLRDSAGATKVVLGDARLSLETAEPQSFDAIVLDAFTGDAPPAHLLTKEAFAIYLRHLRPGGVLAFHITNRRVDLMPVVAGLADHFAYQAVRIHTPWDGDRLQFRSDWVMLTRNAAFVDAVPSVPPPPEGRQHDKVLWTDHYNNLFALLK